MDTCVALVNAYLRFNGYVSSAEHPVLVGEGRPYRYHTATDVDVLAVRFPNAAVVVPRDSGLGSEDDLHLDVDPELKLLGGTVDVIVGEVKQSRPRLNPALREPDVLYATLRRIDPGFDRPLMETITELIDRGVAECESGGRRWRFRLFAFGEGTPVLETGRFTSIQLSHAAMFLISCMREHHQVWKDAQFGDPVLDLLHLIDKMGFSWVASPQTEQAAAANEPVPSEPAPKQHPRFRKAVKPPTAKKVAVKKAAPKKSMAKKSVAGKAPAKKKSKLNQRVHQAGRHRPSK